MRTHILFRLWSKMTVIAFGEIHHNVLCVFRELSSSFCYMEEENYEEFRKDILIILTWRAWKFWKSRHNGLRGDHAIVGNIATVFQNATTAL